MGSRKFCGLKGEYAGAFVGLGGGGMLELLWAQVGLCRNFCGLGGGRMPELLWA